MKKQIFNKPLALLLAIIMVFGLLPATAMADDPEYVSVRIEGSGYGTTDGTDMGIGTILEHTVVNLDDLDAPTAYEAIKRALEMRGLETAVLSASHAPVSFNGVSAYSGYDWNFIYNDAGATNGIYTQTVAENGSIVMYLTADWDSGNYCKDPYYSFFTKKTLSFQNYGYPYVEASLTLKRLILADDWSAGFEPVGGASVTVSTSAENTLSYTCDAATDAENGTLSFSCWAEGEYVISAVKTVSGKNTISRPYCKITVTSTGATVSTYSNAADTTLSALSLTCPDTATASALPYVGTDGMTVNNAVDTAAVTATASDAASGATLTATFKAAGESTPSAYTPGDSAALAVGANTFKFTVTNDTDTQIHTLIITREAATVRNIPAEVAAVIGGVRTVMGDAPYSDWILAMRAAGLAVSAAQLNTCLAAVLVDVDNFVDSGTGSVGTMAKIAAALTSLGIDARQIPDRDGGAAIDLIAEIASYAGTVDPVYAAPYILSLYDLGNYEVPTGAATRLELINAMLAAESDWTAWGFDGVGIVLPALAPYYNATAAVNGIEITKCQDISEAIARALTSMSAAQIVDGGFGAPNSSTVSTVITGLNAIGVNPHPDTDTDFVESGSTLITNLLSFRTSDDKLGYTNNASFNIMSCYQGFQALATWQNLTNGTRNQNLYHFTAEIAPYTAWPDARLLTGIAVTAQPTTATYSYSETETAYVPDTTGLAITATYNANTLDKAVIPITDCTVSTIDRSSPGTKTVTVTYQGQTATFVITVLNSDSSVPAQKTVIVTVRKNSGGVASGTVVIQEGVTSVLDVLKTVLANAGKTYVIKNGSYVAAVDGLGEFDQGPNSGWLYSVNGVTPISTAAGSYLLHDGNTVVWYYTLDYTTDDSSSAWTTTQAATETIAPAATVTNGTAVAAVTASQLSGAAQAAKKSGASAVTITPEISGGVSGISITLPTAGVREIAEGGDTSVVLDTPAGAVELNSAALASIVQQSIGSGIEFSVETKTAADVDLPEENLENSFIVAVSITSAGKNITEFGGNTLKISLPVDDTYPAGETYKVIVISADGTIETLWGKVVIVDGRTTVDVTVAHLSTFVITDQKAGVFSDVAEDAWYAAAVKYAVVNSLLQGISGDLFSPDADMTRAMLAAVLYRLEGSPAVTAANTFTDVGNGTWYTDAIIWASGNGIVNGSGDGLYGTNTPVTRQEMAVMLYRYAKHKGYDVTKTADLTAYEEADSIAAWAIDAMGWANIEGLITGVTGTKLMPDGNASRATVATILMRFVENAAKK